MFRIKKTAATLTGLLAIAILLIAGLPAGEVSASQTLAYLPAADAYVTSTYPAKNFGTLTNLYADASPWTKSYLKFIVPPPTSGNKILSARITVFVQSSSSSGLWLRAVPNNAWGETTITNNNAPVPGVVLSIVKIVSGGTWVSFNVSAYVKAGGTYSFALVTPGSTNIKMASREFLGYKPKLFVVVGVPTPTPTPTVISGDPVLVGAGDIADCGSSGDEATAKLVAAIPGTVFTAGDNAYEDGTLTQFNNCYNPSWGAFKARTKPSPGNHEYHTSGASGYFSYFGAAAGDPSKGYYSYNLGTWHIIALNSEIDVSAASAQVAWLKQDLAANPRVCTLAYWHRPLFSSGAEHGSNPEMAALWQALYDYRADVVVNGHEHNYERFAPQNTAGTLDTARGIREFVVGSGGKNHYGFGTIVPNSLVRNGDTYGVIKFTLHAGSYDWRFVPEAGKTFTDSGTALCVP